jgi:hypothetical protein
MEGIPDLCGITRKCLMYSKFILFFSIIKSHAFIFFLKQIWVTRKSLHNSFVFTLCAHRVRLIISSNVLALRMRETSNITTASVTSYCGFIVIWLWLIYGNLEQRMKKLSVAISLDFWGWGSVSVIQYFELHNELFCSVKGGDFFLLSFSRILLHSYICSLYLHTA